MSIVTSSIVQNSASLVFNIPLLPIDGILINNVLLWFDKFLPMYSSSITLNNLIASYQYLFDLAARITNNNITVPIVGINVPL